MRYEAPYGANNPALIMRMKMMTTQRMYTCLFVCLCTSARCMNSCAQIVINTIRCGPIPLSSPIQAILTGVGAHVKSYHRSKLPEAKCKYMWNVLLLTTCVSHKLQVLDLRPIDHASLCLTATHFHLNLSVSG